MSRKSKIDAIEKVKIIERYLNGEISQKGAANVCGVNKRSAQDWLRIYKTEGPDGLLASKTNRRQHHEDSKKNNTGGTALYHKRLS